MFFKTKTLKSTNDYWHQIKKLKEEIKNTDAILIGGGAGLSTSSGAKYDGKRFTDYFSDYAKKYGLKDMYTAGFYPFSTLEEYWAYWSRHIYLNRYQSEIDKPYFNLFKLIQDKDYFVLTTNVDHKFQKAGFDKNRLFYTQGDYGLWQCSKPCCQETYENKETVIKMIAQQKDMKIPSALIPYCPHCGSPLTMNLRIDNTFAEDKEWHMASSKYTDFIKCHETMHILYLELGVGYNTPAIIKYPFWKMTYDNPNARYCCINYEEIYYPVEIEKQALCIQEDIGKVIEDIYV